jgi:hypothetical protein
MNDELERFWKEAVAEKSGKYPFICLEENHEKKLLRIADGPDRYLNRAPPASRGASSHPDWRRTAASLDGSIISTQPAARDPLYHVMLYLDILFSICFQFAKGWGQAVA